MLKLATVVLKSVDDQLPEGAKLVDWPLNVDAKLSKDTNEQRRLFRGAASVGFWVYFYAATNTFYFVRKS